MTIFYSNTFLAKPVFAVNLYLSFEFVLFLSLRGLLLLVNRSIDKLLHTQSQKMFDRISIEKGEKHLEIRKGFRFFSIANWALFSGV